jgi:hypothetical protein
VPEILAISLEPLQAYRIPRLLAAKADGSVYERILSLQANVLHHCRLAAATHHLQSETRAELLTIDKAGWRRFVDVQSHFC